MNHALALGCLMSHTKCRKDDFMNAVHHLPRHTQRGFSAMRSMNSNDVHQFIYLDGGVYDSLLLRALSKVRIRFSKIASSFTGEERRRGISI